MVELGCKIKAEYHANVLEEKPKPAIQAKRPDTRTDRIIFDHNHAEPHAAKKTTDIIAHLGWEILFHLNTCQIWLRETIICFEGLRNTSKGKTSRPELNLQPQFHCSCAL